MLKAVPSDLPTSQPAVHTGESFACGFHGTGHGSAWVSARGELDLVSASHFQQTLTDAIRQALLVIIDLRQLTFIDSAGINAILDADTEARLTGHRVVLIRGQAVVDRMFRLARGAERLRIVDLDLDLALPLSDRSRDVALLEFVC